MRTVLLHTPQNNPKISREEQVQTYPCLQKQHLAQISDIPSCDGPTTDDSNEDYKEDSCAEDFDDMEGEKRGGRKSIYSSPFRFSGLCAKGKHYKRSQIFTLIE